MKKSIYLLLAFLATFFISCKNDNSNLKDGLYADIRTPKGHIIVQLEFEKAPITVANFVSLAEGKNDFVSEQFKGKHFFDGLNFHRVEPGFVIQGGDPEGNGSGGPGYTFKDEITELKHDKPGSLSMANAGPGTNGSQFFITHVPTPQLDGGYSVFGYVTGNGMEVVNKITADDKIISINIIRNGDAAKKFDAPKVFSDYFSNKASIEKKEAEEKAKANAEVLKQFESGKTTASGIKYIVVKEGNGATPTETSNVKVHYTGTFLDGKVFDSSVQRGQPIDFNLNQVIKGWTEGVQLMKEGAKYKFYIPYQLAYGEQGFQSIPPKSDLLFEIELIKVNN